jgi:hypothetical protein
MHDPLDLDPPDFVPVPMQRHRRNGWTIDRQRAFILALTATGLVGEAARLVGMTPRSAYQLRDHDGAESFAAAWDKAIDRSWKRTLDDALHQAAYGVEEQVFHRGRPVGTHRRRDTRLMIRVLATMNLIKPVTRSTQESSLSDLQDFLNPKSTQTPQNP